MKKAFIITAAAVSPLAAAVLKTAIIPRKKTVYTPSQDAERIEKYAKKLSDMVRYETVSRPQLEQREKFLGFHALLKELFPLVHESSKRPR